MKAKREAELAEDEHDGEATPVFEGPPPSIDELVAEEDAERLLELGAAYRAGISGVPRDAFKALECFEAASRLGSETAEYLVGVAYCDGKGVRADLAEGAKRLRSAAQRGSLRAKVYVANLYEMGVHYQADREKADVWYRNVARAAGIEAAIDSDEYDLRMAELGCVRSCLKLVADEALPAKDRAFYLKKAKTMGYHHRLASAKREPTPAELVVKELTAPEPAKAEVAAPRETPKAAPEEEPDDEAPLLGAQWTWGMGTLAFSAASFFVAASSAVGWLAMEGSRALSAADRPLPHLSGAHHVVLLATVLALGVLPAMAVYRARVVGIAAVVGAAAGVGAHYLWDVSRVLGDRLAQGVGGGLAAFLIVLFLLGVLGGTRARVRAKGKRPPPRSK
jgi:hypothetical protein